MTWVDRLLYAIPLGMAAVWLWFVLWCWGNP